MKASQAFISRWGHETLDDTGYVHVPGFILKHYSQFKDLNNQPVGLTCNEFTFMCHAMSFKFDAANGQAAPSVKTIADRMGMSTRAVHKIIKTLSDKGAMLVIHRPGYTSIYSFEPLVNQCLDFEQLPTPKSSGVNKSSGVGVNKSSGVGVNKSSHEESEGKESESKNKKDYALCSADQPIEVITVQPEQPAKEKKVSEQGAMFGAIVQAFGYDPATLTKSVKSQIGRVAKELLDATCTPDDIAGLYADCVAQGWSSFSPMALSKRWAAYAANRPKTAPGPQPDTPTQTDGVPMPFDMALRMGGKRLRQFGLPVPEGVPDEPTAA